MPHPRRRQAAFPLLRRRRHGRLHRLAGPRPADRTGYPGDLCHRPVAALAGLLLEPLQGRHDAGLGLHRRELQLHLPVRHTGLCLPCRNGGRRYAGRLLGRRIPLGRRCRPVLHAHRARCRGRLPGRQHDDLRRRRDALRLAGGLRDPGGRLRLEPALVLRPADHGATRIRRLGRQERHAARRRPLHRDHGRPLRRRPRHQDHRRPGCHARLLVL